MIEAQLNSALFFTECTPRAGLDALYLSIDTETAIAEYKQSSSLLPPGTVVTYQVTLDRVADFRAGFVDGTWDATWCDLFFATGESIGLTTRLSHRAG